MRTRAGGRGPLVEHHERPQALRGVRRDEGFRLVLTPAQAKGDTMEHIILNVLTHIEDP